MRKLFALPLLMVSLMFATSPAHAEWTKVVETEHSDVLYIDFERIREHSGSVFFWEMTDYLKPSEVGTLSSRIYNEGDCQRFRYRMLSASWHEMPMGEGPADVDKPSGVYADWQYPTPESAGEVSLQAVCDYVAD
jgi:hypothetical protein